MYNYKYIKEFLLSKGIFVLDKRQPVEKIKYLLNCGYKILYAKFGPCDFKYRIGDICGYYPILVDTIIIQNLNDYELSREFKKISYHPDTIIKFALK